VIFLISAFLIVEALMIGRPHMWTRFIMDNDEMTTMVAPPLLKGSSSSIHGCCTSIATIINCQTVDDETNKCWKGDGVILDLMPLYYQSGFFWGFFTFFI